MVQRKKHGTLIIPSGAKPEIHEMRVAQILTAFGDDVIFIVPNNGYKIRSPDIVSNGVEWEIKSPTGSNAHTITWQIKKALKQSRNVIIDTNRTKIADKDIITHLKKSPTKYRSLKHLKIITKSGTIVSIK